MHTLCLRDERNFKKGKIMSWGELTCKHFGNCKRYPTLYSCNKDCNYYERKINMECHCGGVEGTHKIGDSDCLREEVEKKDNPILADLSGKDRWVVEGHIITGFTLRQQRGYHHHGNNDWSRPKDHESVNSLPDET